MLGDKLKHGARRKRVGVDDMKRLARSSGASPDMPCRFDHVVYWNQMQRSVAAAEHGEPYARCVGRDQHEQIVRTIELVDYTRLAVTDDDRRPQDRDGKPAHGIPDEAL